jgi:hypothetical protein
METFGVMKIAIVAFSTGFIPIVAAKLRLDHKLHAANGEFLTVINSSSFITNVDRWEVT